ncbi:hypothetical protein HU200_048936 [Digitaria exilis]|uniref:DUF4220 domain-containing protein n=1 Tax=Digitaria exilis TaxID=1010633 RepID=A0A835ECP1_9POAL|nr:hypothetical protein HU200_048936 [Digitaria exilis]
MLNKNANILIRIEFLVIAISVLFLVMFILDFRRNRSHAALRQTILKVLDGVSDSMVVYTIGAMQGATFRNQLFPVWDMVVVSFRSSIDYISGRESRGFETGNSMRPLGLALLNSRRGSQLKVQLWTLWGVMLLRSSYRIIARYMALNVSYWIGHSAKFITEYMRGDHEDTNLRPDACNPSTVEGYTYLVYGELSQALRMQKPRYIAYLHIIRGSKLVTLDRIWKCDGRLLSSNDSRGEQIKDMCLAFSVSGLLRCQLEDAELHSDSLFLTRKLARSKILMKGANRAFRILEMELTFLNDTLHTRYPIIFWRGLLSLCLSMAVSCFSFGVALWLAVDIHRIYKPPEGDLMHVVRGANVDIIITWVLMLFMMFKEIWEMVTYLLSDWTRLLLVCKYVEWECFWMRNSLTEKLIWSFFTSKIGNRWHGLMDQYEFLRSFDYIPSTWNGLHSATLGLVPKKNNGAKLSTAVEVPECVKPAIMRTLRRLSIDDLVEEDGRRRLPNEIPSLSSGDMMDSFGWACRLRKCSQVIMVWHIATSLCEINLALDRGVVGVSSEPAGCLCSALSSMKNFFCCSSQPPYLVDDINQLDDAIKDNYLIANSLSRYCAYLLMSQPEMLPDSFLLPELIFNATVEDAKHVLEGTNSLKSRYDTLMKEASSKSSEEKDKIKSKGNLVQQGAVLAWDLLQLQLESNKSGLHWKILAGVWVDLIVHIAPSRNRQAHITRLKSGGEFLSHIWALLCHFGIESSRLWQRE